MRKLILSLGILSIFLSCGGDANKLKNGLNRPLENWVFRTVLDEKPRMLVAALHRDLYLAYDTQKAKLYKAWKGIVNLQGAVHDGAHGPQPMSIGDAYILDDSESPAWSIRKGDSRVNPQIEYKGHGISDGTLDLHYGLKAGDDEILVSERADYSESATGQLTLSRNFLLANCPPGTEVHWHGTALLVDKSQITTNSELEFGEPEEIRFGSKIFRLYHFSVVLSGEGETRLDIPLLETVYLDPNIEDGFDSEDSSLPRGAQLIAKNDCRTCHNVSKKTVGPSYKDIARKYEHTGENKEMLISKVVKGGSGVWGEQVMTPHPEIPKYDLDEMLSYIFTLAEYEGEKTEATGDLVEIQSTEVNSDQLIPGALTRIFRVNPDTERLPDGLLDKKPIQAGILENMDNLSGGDFIGLEKHFALSSFGYLDVAKTGKYSFRIWSDDGSKLYLHEKLLIDNDGLHGTNMKQVDVKLEKGLHPFRLEYFQGLGGMFLSFNMKGPDDASWRVVPSSMFIHNRNDHKYLSELSLPMSVMSKIPGDGLALDAVHPAFNLSQAHPLDFNRKIGGIDFLSDGRMLVSTWDSEGAIFILENHDSDDPESIRFTKIASGLAEPLGLKVVDDRIFVMQKQELTELIDTDGDEIIDEYRTLCDDWGVTANFHEFGFGLEEKDGYLYANLATGILPGGAGMPNQNPDRGSCIKVDIEDGTMEIIANGLRTPNGIGLGYNDEVFASDNQGDWLPASKIVHVTPGDWFGSRAVDFDGTEGKQEKRPVVWLPQDEIGNSPSTPLYLDLGPYKNQMIHGEVTHGGIKRVFVEEVNGEYQGCVFRFIQGLEAGINRIRWAPDGALYAGGIGNPGNWQHSGKNWYGLQRLEYNGNSVFEMLAVRARSNGIEIEFTEALSEGEGWIPSDYEIRQWYYEPTAEYGGPKLDEKILPVARVNVSDDRKKVFLELEDMQEDHVVYIRLKNHFVSDQDHELWTTEAWYTMNSIPADKPGFQTVLQDPPKLNSLTKAEEEAGWELLFDGKTLDKWHSFNKDTVAACWEAADGTIRFDASGDVDRGDLVTNKEFENFELRLEWKISNCGNSGILFNVREDEKYCCPYLTGPEMQVLDNTCHPDARINRHRAGDLYDMISCAQETVKPAGEWNKVRLISDNGDVQFWLNGHKVVTFTMHNEEWKNMIANSKFKDWEDFGRFKSGKIVLQDHDDKVWYRNIKIRKL